MIGLKEVARIAAHKSRGRRDTSDLWDATDRDTWVDSIGMPRGVPNEFKLVPNRTGGRGASAARGSCGGGSGEQRQVRVIGTPVSS